MAQFDYANLLSNPDFLSNEELLKMLQNKVSVEETPTQPKLAPAISDEELSKQIYASLGQSLQQQSAQVENLKAQALREAALQKETGVLGRLDIRPFAQAVKGYGATNVAIPTEAPEDRSAILQKLENAVFEAQQGISKQQLEYLKAKAMEAYKEKLLGLGERRFGLAEKRLQSGIEQKGVASIKGDKLLNEYVSKINSIDRANESLFAASKIPVQSLKEYQQNLRSAITSIKGQGGVTERASTYIDSMDQDLAKLTQYFGELDSIPKNHPIILHLKELGDLARNELKQQAAERADIASTVSIAGVKGKLEKAIEPKSTEAKEDPMLKQIKESRAAIEKKMQELSPKK